MMDCREFRVLAARFSTGVTIRELVSVAEIVSSLARISPPSRDAKRNFGLMIRWFRSRWTSVGPWLPLISLCDEERCIIDGARELSDKKKQAKSAKYLT
jgi:hypothetical protein